VTSGNVAFPAIIPYMTDIKPIPTEYGGYKFRSRLEARWAVAFDAFDIFDWDYEYQGFDIRTPRGRTRYLPDFWLTCGQWAEVKGFLDLAGMRRLHMIASALAECGSGNDLVVFGDVPRPRSILWPVQLHHHGKLWAVPWEPVTLGCPLGRPRVAVEATEEMAAHLVSGFPFGRPDWAEDGLERARKARFEWGESG
jgi:hypothetical protein